MIVSWHKSSAVALLFFAATGIAAQAQAKEELIDLRRPADQAALEGNRFSDSPYRLISEEETITCSDCEVDACCEPVWYVSAGFIALTRSDPAAGRIIATNPGGTQISGGEDFNFGWDVGYDVTLARRLWNDDVVEVRHFAIDNGADLAFVSPSSFIGAGFTGPGGTSFVGRYLTQLNSTEVNWRRGCSDRLAVLAGFRTIEVKDALSYNLNTTVAAAEYVYANHLYGGQLGADLALTDASRPWQVNVTGKAGIYANSYNGGTRDFAPAGNPVLGYNGSDSGTSFVGDLGINASRQITSWLAIRAGYQLLWIDTVALASDNASFSIFNPSLLATTTQTNDIFYHGATGGIEITW